MQLKGSGVNDVAVVSAIFAADDLGKATSDLLALTKEMVWEMNKRFVIFDMDGTLIDSMEIWSNLGREYLHSKGIVEDIEKVLEEIASLTMSESAELFVERFSLLSNANIVAREMNCIMEEHYKNDISLKKGMKKYLETLRKSGVRMCVVSATKEYLMELCLERLEVLHYFDFIYSCESMTTNKRESKIYLKASSRFHAAPEEMAVYEDALYAVKTAKKAGFYVVGVYDEYSNKQWKQICDIADEVIILN